MDKELLERAIYTLQAYYDCSRDVLDVAANEQLEDDIAQLKQMLKMRYRTVYEGNYCSSSDRTFVMKETYYDGNLIKAECVGWHYGQPDEEYNDEWHGSSLVAEFDV